MVQLKSVLAALFLILFPSLGLAQDAGQAKRVAFAKFSPVQAFSEEALTNARPLAVPFGTAMPLLSTTDLAAQVLVDDAPVWLHRADVFVPMQEKYVDSGEGFRVAVRPALRFWRSLGVFGDFLAHGDLQNAGADMEEFRGASRTTFSLHLPVVAEDVVDVLGARPIRVAAVMLPIQMDVAEEFEKARGAVQTEHNISFVIDVSGDAFEFSTGVFKDILSELRRRLRDSDVQLTYNLTLFGSHLSRGFKVSEGLEIEELRERTRENRAVASNFREPLLKALDGTSGIIDAETTSNVVVALSGADLVEESFILARGEQISLQTPKLTFPENTAVLFAQVTPEPGDDLAVLAKTVTAGGGVEHFPFATTLGSQISRRILAFLKADDARTLEDAELAQVCELARSQRTLCVLPFEARTDTPLPRAPVRAADGDWYSTVVWVVLDGLILRSSDNPKAGE